MCVPWEPREKVGAGRARGVWIERGAFLIIVIMRRPFLRRPFQTSLASSPYSLFSEEFICLCRGCYICLLGKARRLKTVSMPPDLLGPKAVAEQVDSVFICDLYVFNTSISLPTTGTRCLLVPSWGISVYVLPQWTNAIHPRVGLSSSIFLSVLQSTWFSGKKWDFPGYCYQTASVYTRSCAHKAHSYHHTHHQQVAVRDRSGKIMAPHWIVWIIAMTSW